MSSASAAAETSRNPFEAARARLIRRLCELVVPDDYPVFPRPSNHEGIAQHIREAAELFDEWLRAIGDQVEDNSPYNIDSCDFDHAFEGAVCDAAYSCERVAERMRDEREAA